MLCSPYHKGRYNPIVWLAVLLIDYSALGESYYDIHVIGQFVL